jgi:hypothetical protein
MLGRAEQVHRGRPAPRVIGKLACHLIGRLGARGITPIAVEIAHQPNKRRIAMLTTKIDLLAEEAVVVVPGRRLEWRSAPVV